MGKWRPIETAPRDGTEVLGAWAFIFGLGWCIQPVIYHNEGWIVSWDHDGAEPTHWMPLPKPPEDT